MYTIIYYTIILVNRSKYLFHNVSGVPLSFPVPDEKVKVPRSHLYFALDENVFASKTDLYVFVRIHTPTKGETLWAA